MDLGRRNKGEGVAGISAILLFGSLFLDWYRFEQGGGLLVLISPFGMSGSPWATLGAVPVFLALTVAITIGGCLSALRGSKGDRAVSLGLAVAVLGAISALLIFHRIVVPPGPEEFPLGGSATIPFYARPELSAYLALLAAVGIGFGGCLAMSQEGRPGLGAEGAFKARGAR